jgi:2-dehydropantoate 2-reductase
MRAADMTVRMYSDPERMKWSKALTNIVSNASSAILGWTPAQVFGNKGLYRLELEALRETVRIMQKRGMRPLNLPGVPLTIMGYGVFLPAPLTRNFFGRIVARGRGDKPPSFQQDIGRGRSEVEWLNGAIANFGDKLGVPTPANRLLYETMMTLVNRPQEHERYLGKPSELLRLAAKAGVPGIQGYNHARGQ